MNRTTDCRQDIYKWLDYSELSSTLGNVNLRNNVRGIADLHDSGNLNQVLSGRYWFWRNGMLPLANFLFLQHQNPKFLGHVLIGEQGPIALQKLIARDELKYHTNSEFNYWNEFSFSIHGPAGGILNGEEEFSAIPGANSANHGRSGTVVFNDLFYDTIASANITKNEIDEIRAITSVLYEKYSYYAYSGTYRAGFSKGFFKVSPELFSALPYINGIETSKLFSDIDGDKSGRLIRHIDRALETISQAKDGFTKDRVKHNSTGWRAVNMKYKCNLESLSIRPDYVKYVLKHEARGDNTESCFQIVVDNS